MSLDTPTAPPEPSAAPAAAPAPDPSAGSPAPSPAEGSPTPDNWATRTPESLIDEIKQLRAEAKKGRTEWKPYAELFTGMDADLARQITDFASAVKAGDAERYTGWVGKWAADVGLTKAEMAEVVADATDDGDKPLTKAALAEALKEFETQKAAEEAKTRTAREQAEAAEAMRRHVAELGYDEAKNPVLYEALYGLAGRYMRESHFRLEAKVAIDQAHEALEGFRTQVIDEYVAGRRQEAGRVVTPSGVGGAPTQDTTPKSIEDATARATARFRAAQAQ